MASALAQSEQLGWNELKKADAKTYIDILCISPLVNVLTEDVHLNILMIL